MRSALSLLAPILTPITPCMCVQSIRRCKRVGCPRLLNPMRLITARSSASRNRRGLRIARLRPRRQRAHLDEAEAERQHLLGHLGILVEARGEPDRSREVEPGDRRPQRSAESRAGGAAARSFSAAIVARCARLRVEREGQRADERVEGIADRHAAAASPVIARAGSGRVTERLSFDAKRPKSDWKAPN